MEWLCLLDDEVECKVLRQGGCLILFFLFFCMLVFCMVSIR